MKKVASERRGADLKMSKTQIEKTAQRGCSIFYSLFSLARPLIKPAVKALASAGLSFGAEKALKKIFGNGYGSNEIQLYKLVQRMTPAQKKAVEIYLVGRGIVSGSGQYGGFLGMLASIGVPIAIDLISKMFGKGLQVKPQRGQDVLHPRKGEHPRKGDVACMSALLPSLALGMI